MRSGDRQETPRVSEVVKRAVEICDGDVGVEGGLGDFLIRFEDRDEPITALEDPKQVFDEALGALDPDETDGRLQMAGAIATYLAFRRDEVADDPADVIRLAARAEFDGHPPPPVANWLQEQGIEV